MIAVGQRAVIAEGAWTTIGDTRRPMPEWVGLLVEVIDRVDADGDHEVRTDDGRDLFVNAACLRVPFEQLAAEVASDAVRAVEDAVDAHLDWWGRADGEHAPAVLRALLELGWTPPAVTA